MTVYQMLSNKRGDTVLFVGRTRSLAGIQTDTDVTRRVVFANLDLSSSYVSRVMRLNPTMVSINDSDMDALSTMVENRCRHLHVADSSGIVVGMLDITKCLNDAIRKLERSQDKTGSATEDDVQQMSLLQGVGGSQAAMFTQFFGLLIAQTFGYKEFPTLCNLLTRAPSTIVPPQSTIK